MVHTWNKEYYEIINFYYWEPQHLGKIKNTKNKLKSLDDVLSHVSKMEVSLNHQFNIFFQLLPNNILNTIIKKISESYRADDILSYQSIESINKLNLKDATQPDIFFKGDKSLVGIEFKLASKSSIEQLLKYAMLFHFSQEQSVRTKECHLIYIGCTTFNDLFKEGFHNIRDLQNMLTVDRLEDKTKKGEINLVPIKDKIIHTAKNMSINFINYQSLFDLLHFEKSQIISSSAYSETIAKLLEGMSDELIFRGLAKA